MSSVTSTKSTENLVNSNLLLIPDLKNSTSEKQSVTTYPSGFHSLMDGDSKVIYGLNRRNMSIHFKKFHFLYVMHVKNVSVKGAVGFSRLSKGPTAINSLRTPNLAECRVNTCEYKIN